MALCSIKRNLPPYANRAKNITVYFCSKVLSQDINTFIECVKVTKSEVKSFIILQKVLISNRCCCLNFLFIKGS